MGGVGHGTHLVGVLALCLGVRAAWPGDKYRIYPCQDLSYSVGKAGCLSEASEVPRAKPEALLRLRVPSRNLAPRL